MNNFFGNIFGLFYFVQPPTADPSTTFALSITAFVFYNLVGIKDNGVLKYAKHFLGPVMFLAPLMLIIELISHAARILSLAIRLQSAGIQTTVIEARDKPGGRAYFWEKDGFTFDAGPTVITDPPCLKELWELTGHDIAEDVELIPKDSFTDLLVSFISMMEILGCDLHSILGINKFCLTPTGSMDMKVSPGVASLTDTQVTSIRCAELGGIRI